jgi:hypothetical protein
MTLKYKITKTESSLQIFLLPLHVFFKEKYFIISDRISLEGKLPILFITLQEYDRTFYYYPLT